MKIRIILIEDDIKEKILDKHSIEASEIEEVLLQRPLVLKSKLGRYLAIGHCRRYLTIVFAYRDQTANIITAYSSSETQIKLYKKKRE